MGNGHRKWWWKEQFNKIFGSTSMDQKREGQEIIPRVVPVLSTNLQASAKPPAIPPRWIPYIRIGVVVSLLGFVGWLLQNFLQLRGVVDLLASRIDLVFLWGCLFVVGWILTINVQRKGFARIVIGIFLGAVVYGLDMWAPKPKPKPPMDFPYVQALLIIDSVKARGVGYHFQLESKCERLLKDIKFDFSNERVTDIQNMIPFGGTLPAGGKIEVSGPPSVFLPYKGSYAVATMSYGAEGTTDRFASKYRFFVDANKEKTIAPEGWSELSGITEGPSMSEVLRKAEGSQGTLAMVIPESLPDGEPNVVTYKDDRKYLRFDPISQAVDYYLLLNSGRQLRFKLPLKSHGGHIILFTWDYGKGGGLSVDGVAQDNTKPK